MTPEGGGKVTTTTSSQPWILTTESGIIPPDNRTLEGDVPGGGTQNQSGNNSEDDQNDTSPKDGNDLDDNNIYHEAQSEDTKLCDSCSRQSVVGYVLAGLIGAGVIANVVVYVVYFRRNRDVSGEKWKCSN